MRIVHWNIRFNSDKEKIVEALKRFLTGGDTIFCLQEVTPAVKDYIMNQISQHLQNYHISYAYSLDFRQPGKYDGMNRTLGVLMICTQSMYIIDAGVFHRTPMPERTLHAEILYEGEILKLTSLNSVTGTNYRKAKSNQFLTFAEAVDSFKPDIVTIDSKEPEIDHYDLNQIKFYDYSGKEARIFFDALKENGLVDTLSNIFPISDFEHGTPLAASVNVKGEGYRRHDQIFANAERFYIYRSEYHYDLGIEATSDHAILMAVVEINKRESAGKDRDNQLHENCMYPYNSMQECRLIKFCRYYGHENEKDNQLLADYEKHWIDDVLKGEMGITHYVSGHDLNWLQTFNIEDGVPLGLKAILFNRYFHWSDYSTVDDFKHWYLTKYLSGK